MKRCVLVLLAFLGCRASADEPDVGCGGRIEDPLASLIVRSARLENLTIWQGGLGVGHAEGDARLVVIDLDDERHTFRARLDGHHLGLTADLSSYFPGNRYDLELPRIDIGTLSARDLLGSYSGLHVGLTAGVGGHFRALENEHRVKLGLSGLTFGLGAVPASWESLDLELWNDPRRVVPDDGEDDDCRGFFCPADDDDDDDDDWDDNDVCLEEGDGCDLDADVCCAGRCAPTNFDGLYGECRPTCGVITQDGLAGARAEKTDETRCDRGTSCQVVTALPDLSLAEVACMPENARMHEKCAAAFDVENGDNACVGQLECQPAGVAYGWSGERLGFQSLRCKKPCDPNGDAESLAYCTDFGERCMQVPATVGLESPLFACAAAVPSLTYAAQQTQGLNLDESFLCDEINASRFCDDVAFLGVAPEDAGFTTCLEGAWPGAAVTAGYCLSVCAIPAQDIDYDGVITPGVDVEAFEGACAPGYACSEALTDALDFDPRIGTCEPLP